MTASLSIPTPPAVVLHTERLVIRHMGLEDAPFMLELLNDDAWIRFIGDRGVRTLDDARRHIVEGPMDMVRRLGFGFHVVALKEGGCPVGICGLAKRDYLDDIDIGYGFLPGYRGQGYAYEAARGMLAYAIEELKLRRIVATVVADNAGSATVLKKLGLAYERDVDHPDGTRLQLYAIEVN